jgi:hypothetical protein
MNRKSGGAASAVTERAEARRFPLRGTDAMRRWQLAVAAATLLAAGGHAAADWPNHFRARPPLACGVPPLDYYYRPHSATTEAVSTFGMLLETALPGEPAPQRHERIRYYQLDVARLQVDHCILSRIAVSLHADGSWIFSARADQNPWMAPNQLELSPIRPGGPRVVKHTEHLKRNEFFIKFRAYTAFGVKETLLNDSTGKPVLFAVSVPPFWVQRGEPYDVQVRGALADVGTYFHLVDRIQVEFFYR